MSEIDEALVKAGQLVLPSTAGAAQNGPTMEFDVFISYRRQDAGGLAR